MTKGILKFRTQEKSGCRHVLNSFSPQTCTRSVSEKHNKDSWRIHDSHGGTLTIQPL